MVQWELYFDSILFYDKCGWGFLKAVSDGYDVAWISGWILESRMKQKDQSIIFTTDKYHIGERASYLYTTGFLVLSPQPERFIWPVAGKAGPPSTSRVQGPVLVRHPQGQRGMSAFCMQGHVHEQRKGWVTPSILLGGLGCLARVFLPRGTMYHLTQWFLHHFIGNSFI